MFFHLAGMLEIERFEAAEVEVGEAAEVAERVEADLLEMVEITDRIMVMD